MFPANGPKSAGASPTKGEFVEARWGPALRRYFPPQQFRLLKDRLGRLLLLVGRVSMLPEDAADHHSQLGPL